MENTEKKQVSLYKEGFDDGYGKAISHIAEYFAEKSQVKFDAYLYTKIKEENERLKSIIS